MNATQKLAIAAHLHVLLRRKTGRVTDTEWMAENLEYALEIVRFAKAKAAEDGHADLAEWATRLELAATTPAPKAPKPLVQQAAQLIRQQAAPAATAPPAGEPPADESHSGFASTGFSESSFAGERRKPKDPDAPRYVGGIR